MNWFDLWGCPNWVTQSCLFAVYHTDEGVLSMVSISNEKCLFNQYSAKNPGPPIEWVWNFAPLLSPCCCINEKGLQINDLKRKKHIKPLQHPHTAFPQVSPFLETIWCVVCFISFVLQVYHVFVCRYGFTGMAVGLSELSSFVSWEPGGYIPAPSNRSPLVAFGDLRVAGGDLLVSVLV